MSVGAVTRASVLVLCCAVLVLQAQSSGPSAAVDVVAFLRLTYNDSDGVLAADHGLTHPPTAVPLNESDYTLQLQPWRPTVQRTIATSRLQLRVAALPQSARLVSLLTLGAADLRVVPEPSAPLCIEAGGRCTVTLELQASYTQVRQAAPAALVIGTDAFAPFALQLPFDACRTSFAEARLRVGSAEGVYVDAETVQATLYNDGDATGSISCALSCPRDVLVALPTAVLTCTLTPGQHCNVSFTLWRVTGAATSCVMKEVVNVLPCWSDERKSRWTVVEVPAVAGYTEPLSTATVVAIAIPLGVLAAVLVTLLVVWLMAAWQQRAVRTKHSQWLLEKRAFFRARLQQRDVGAFAAQSE